MLFTVRSTEKLISISLTIAVYPMNISREQPYKILYPNWEYMRTNWKLITTLPEVHELIGYCKATGYCCFDFETNGHPVHSDLFVPTVMGVSFQPGSGWVIPLGHFDSPFEHMWEDIFFLFGKEVIENPAIVKFVWNLLFEYRICIKFNITPYGRVLDAMLFKYLLNEERPNGLKDLVDELLPEFSGYDLQGKPGEKATGAAIVRFWSNVPLMELSKYCAGDCDFTFRLALYFEAKLIHLDLYHLARNLYMPLIRVLAPTILSGVRVDRPYLAHLVVDYADKIKKLEDGIFDIPVVKEYNETYRDEKIADYIETLERRIINETLSQRQIDTLEEKISRLEVGEATTKKEAKLLEPINFNSPKQLIDLLYRSDNGLQFPILDRTDKGDPSTSEETLLKLKPEDDSGFIAYLLDLRGISKLYTTYIKGIYEERLTPYNRIHPTYLPHGTVTGRLSSRYPNFQNIPRTATGPDIKRMFITPQDYYFFEIDASQAELRVVAEASGDETMLEIFRSGKNIHVATAALVSGVDYAVINKGRKDENHPDHDWAVKEHKKAKVLNFTILYGASPGKVAEFLTESMKVKTSKEQAKGFIADWFRAYPGVEKWIQKTQKSARRDGYVTNLFGRKRRLPILLQGSAKSGEFNEALRQAVNSVIQGAASDMTQWVNICIWEGILKGEIPVDFPMVSTVHDSLEYYVHKTKVHEFAKKAFEIASTLPNLKEYMGETFKKVPMKFSGELGINWGRMHEYDPNLDYVAFYDSEWESYDKSPFPHTSYIT